MRSFKYITYQSKKYYDTKTFFDKLSGENFPELRIVEHGVEDIEFQKSDNSCCRVIFERRNFPVSKKIKLINHVITSSSIINCTFLIFTSDNLIFNYYYPQKVNRRILIYPIKSSNYAKHNLPELYSEMKQYKKIFKSPNLPFKELNPESIWFEEKQIDFTFFKNFKSPVNFYVENNKIHFFRIYNYWQVHDWIDENSADEKFRVLTVKITTGNDDRLNKYVNISSIRNEQTLDSLYPHRILFRGKYRMEIYYTTHIFANDMEKFNESTGIPELDRIIFTY